MIMPTTPVLRLKSVLPTWVPGEGLVGQRAAPFLLDLLHPIAQTLFPIASCSVIQSSLIPWSRRPLVAVVSK